MATRASNTQSSSVSVENDAKCRLLGLLSVGVLVGLWTSGGYLYKYLQSSSEKNGSSYDKPFFMVWISQLSLICILFFTPSSSSSDGHSSSSFSSSVKVNPKSFVEASPSSTSAAGVSSRSGGKRGKKPHESTDLSVPLLGSSSSSSSSSSWLNADVAVFIVLGFLILSYRCLWPISLRWTTVSMNTVLYDSYVLMVFVLSVWFLNEPFLFIKGIAVILGFGGVVMISLMGDDVGEVPTSGEAHTTLGGIGLTLFGAFVYSLYSVAYKKLLPAHRYHYSTRATLRTAGHQGLSCFLLGSPLILLLHFFNIEPFELPPWEMSVILPIAIMCFQTSFYYSFLALALKYTSPSLVAVGTMLVLPITAVIDFVVYDYRLGTWQLVGALLVVMAFVIMTYEDLKKTKKRESMRV